MIYHPHYQDFNLVNHFRLFPDDTSNLVRSKRQNFHWEWNVYNAKAVLVTNLSTFEIDLNAIFCKWYVNYVISCWFTIHIIKISISLIISDYFDDASNQVRSKRQNLHWEWNVCNAKVLVVTIFNTFEIDLNAIFFKWSSSTLAWQKLPDWSLPRDKSHGHSDPG